MYDLATRLALPSRLACTGDEDAWRVKVAFAFCAGARQVPAVGRDLLRTQEDVQQDSLPGFSMMTQKIVLWRHSL